MGHSVVPSDAKIYIAEFDLSGDMNAHSIERTINLPEDTSYGDSFRQRLVGVQDAAFTLAGFLGLSGAGDQDTVMNAKMGSQDVPVIIASDGSAVGDPAEFGLVTHAQYDSILNHGDVAAFSLAGSLANRKWIRGRVLWTPATAITGTADGAEVELGAVSAAQKLYAAIAVSSANVSSVTIKVQSDVTGFGTPTDQITFTAFSDVTSEHPTPADGAIADTFYRASISAFTGTTATAIVVAGIA